MKRKFGPLKVRIGIYGASGLFIAALIISSGALADRNNLVVNTYGGKPAKYVFLFIGDGMGLSQVASAEVFANAVKGGKTPENRRVLSFTSFGCRGLVTTHDAGSFITDSASAGTALATGHKTFNGIISMDTAAKEKYISIAALAKNKGMKVGIVTSVSIDHATPAVFYAHAVSRKMMYEIGLQLPESGFDYFAGGSAADPDGVKSTMAMKPGNLFTLASANGYRVVKTKAAFDALSPSAGKVWAVTEHPADESSMPYDIDAENGSTTLAGFTQKGIELLDNKNGFFMMVEGGKIDWACHSNDGMCAIKDIFAFDDAVKKAVAFAQRHPNETLIVVTGDHECGGMTIGFAGTKYDMYLSRLSHQKISFQKFSEMLRSIKKQNGSVTFSEIMPLITQYFGLTADKSDKEMGLSDYEMKLLTDAFDQSLKKQTEKSESLYLLYGDYDPLAVTVIHILNRKAGIGWTTYSHTGIPVPAYASGIGQELFNGFYDNTDIFKKLSAVMKVE